jgi:hypothetical protein
MKAAAKALRGSTSAGIFCIRTMTRSAMGFMIWPEFLDDAGNPLPEGEVAYQGLAHMFILNRDMREQTHRQRIAVGVRGYFVEGPKRVAEREVTKLIGLADPSTGR